MPHTPRSSRGILNDRRGSFAAWGAFAIILFSLLAAGVLDVWRLQETRHFADRVALDAALRGASQGRDWNYYYATGQIALDPNTARTAALATVQAAMSRARIAVYTCDVRVLPNQGGGSIPNYPPVPGAGIREMGTWTSTEPAVGVYLEIPVQTFFFGWVNGASSISVHAFAAAGVR